MGTGEQKMLQDFFSKHLKDRICKIKQYLNDILMMINQNTYFSLWFFFHVYSRYTGQQVKGGGYFFNFFLQLPPASQTLRH